MLAATWVLAGSTAVLALGAVVTIIAWRTGRRADRDRAQREREAEIQERTLERAGREFATRDSVGLAVLGLAAAGLIAWNAMRGQQGK